MRLFIALALISGLGCAASAAPQDTPDSISGTLQFDPNSPPEHPFGLDRSEFFDPEKTRLSAETAEQGGNFERAFHDYWATCDAGMANSCLRAAVLADTRLVDGIPGPLIKHLYDQACVHGVSDACRVAASWEDFVD